MKARIFSFLFVIFLGSFPVAFAYTTGAERIQFDGTVGPTDVLCDIFSTVGIVGIGCLHDAISASASTPVASSSYAQAIHFPLYDWLFGLFKKMFRII